MNICEKDCLQRGHSPFFLSGSLSLSLPFSLCFSLPFSLSLSPSPVLPLSESIFLCRSTERLYSFQGGNPIVLLNEPEKTMYPRRRGHDSSKKRLVRAARPRSLAKNDGSAPPKPMRGRPGYGPMRRKHGKTRSVSPILPLEPDANSDPNPPQPHVQI